MPKSTVTITAAWLRRIGDHAQILLEIDGRWRLVAEEYYDGAFSHIAEAINPERWPPDPVTEPIKERPDAR